MVDDPHWALCAIREVAQFILPGVVVLEWGGGSSTSWLLSQGARLTTVEHDRGWYEQLRALHGADPMWQGLYIVPTETGPPECRGSAIYGWPVMYYEAYVDAPGEMYDAVLIDGRARSACLARTIRERLVKPGGLLLLDDSQRKRYQPAMSLVPPDWPCAVHADGKRMTTTWRVPE